MKKTPNHGPADADEMRLEYDFSGGVRGKYAERYRQQLTAVVEREGDGFAARVDQAYRELAESFAGRIVAVDGSRGPDELADLIRERLRDVA